MQHPYEAVNMHKYPLLEIKVSFENNICKIFPRLFLVFNQR